MSTVGDGGRPVTKRSQSDKGELTLVIAGPPESGRTTVASIVAAALREAGAEVTVNDDEIVERFGPLTGRRIRIQVRGTVQPNGAPLLRIVK